MTIWHNRAVGSAQGGGPALVSVTVQKTSGAIVEVADDVMHASGGMTVRAAGRQTELTRTEPGQLQLNLNNDGGDYTPGYASAPVSLAQDTPVWVRETVGRRSFPLFDGVMQQPQASFGGLPNRAGDTVSVSAVDWVGTQQDQGRKFISNLGEYILFHGGDALVEYWPMTETARPFLPVKNAAMPAISSRVFGSSAEPNDGDARITPAAGAMPLAEDSRIPVIGGPLDSGGFPAFTYHLGATLEGSSEIIPIANGQVFTLVVWINPVVFSGVVQWLLDVSLLELPSFASTLMTVAKQVSGVVTLDASLGVMTGTITGSGMDAGRPYPIGVRFGVSPNVFEFWQGRKRFAGTLSGSPPSSYRYFNCDSGAFNSQGSFGHLQLYVGAASDYTFTDYLAQIDHAENALTGGLRWQRTDERIATVSRYVGLTDSQLALDRGVAYMPRASLAGKTWATVAQEAVDTEQGRLLWRDNALRFDNRVNTKYNV